MKTQIIIIIITLVLYIDVINGNSFLNVWCQQNSKLKTFLENSHRVKDSSFLEVSFLVSPKYSFSFLGGVPNTPINTIFTSYSIVFFNSRARSVAYETAKSIITTLLIYNNNYYSLNSSSD